jgi:hypothetical protein
MESALILARYDRASLDDASAPRSEQIRVRRQDHERTLTGRLNALVAALTSRRGREIAIHARGEGS